MCPVRKLTYFILYFIVFVNQKMTDDSLGKVKQGKLLKESPIISISSQENNKTKQFSICI